MARRALVGTVALAVGLIALLSVPADAQAPQTASEQIGFKPVLDLLELTAISGKPDRKTVATALEGFMGGLITYLDENTQVPDVTLNRVSTQFQSALERYLNAGISRQQFGTQMVNIGRQLQTAAQLHGVQGIPASVLTSVGVPTQVVNRMTKGKMPDRSVIPKVVESMASTAQQAKDKGKDSGEEGKDKGDQGKEEGQDKGDNGEDKGDQGKDQGDDGKDKGGGDGNGKDDKGQDPPDDPGPPN